MRLSFGAPFTSAEYEEMSLGAAEFTKAIITIVLGVSVNREEAMRGITEGVLLANRLEELAFHSEPRFFPRFDRVYAWLRERPLLEITFTDAQTSNAALLTARVTLERILRGESVGQADVLCAQGVIGSFVLAIKEFHTEFVPVEFSAPSP